MTDYVSPPDSSPPQWSREDLARAKAAGRNELIVAAQERGQLRDIMHDGLDDPGPSRRGSTVSAKDIIKEES